jgi:hypothetical protein
MAAWLGACRIRSVARAPLGRLANSVAGSRDWANRSLGLVAGSLAYLRAMREGTVPGPLLLAIRAANELAARLAQQNAPPATPAQRRTLLAAAAQIRLLTRGIIVSAEGRDPKSLEAELSLLIQRTLALVDQVTAESADGRAISVVETHLIDAPND